MEGWNPYGDGRINLTIRSSSIGSAYDYNILSITAKNNNKIEKLKITTRAFCQIGNGSNWAEESKLGLAGANNEEMMNSKFTRANGIITSEHMNYRYTTNNFHAAGGLNLRGYSGYLAPEFNSDGTISSFDYNGTSGASLNTEIDRILNTLNDKEARVVRLFFGIDQKTPKSLDEIGQEFDLTRERVRQIREKALRKLKKHADNPLLKSFLG